MTPIDAIRSLEYLKQSGIFPYSDSHGNMIKDDCIDYAISALNREQQFLDAGYKNERVEFSIRGRKFMVKEIAQ